MQNEILISLTETNFLTRWPCDVCGGCTDKVPILAEGEVEMRNGGTCTVRVCEACLEAGNFVERAWEYAKHGTAGGRFAVDIASRLRVPSFEDWLQRCEDHNRRIMEAHADLI